MSRRWWMDVQLDWCVRGVMGCASTRLDATFIILSHQGELSDRCENWILLTFLSGHQKKTDSRFGFLFKNVWSQTQLVSTVKNRAGNTDAELTPLKNQWNNRQSGKTAMCKIRYQNHVKKEKKNWPSKSKTDKVVITSWRLCVRRITLLCGQLVGLVQEITGCERRHRKRIETASNEAGNLCSEGPINTQAGGSAGHI